MFPLLLGALAIGAGTAVFSRSAVNVDVDGDRMVARAIEMLGLKEKINMADSALHDTLLDIRVNSADLTAQGLLSMQRVTDDVHETLALARILLLVVAVWYTLKMLAWAVWVWRGDREKKQEPVVILLLGSGVEAGGLSIGTPGNIQAVCDIIQWQLIS